MPNKIGVSTQDHLLIEDIVDDIVILKDGSATLILQTTAVNFGLLSEKEQDATIFAYAALLNSLSFPVEIVIRSKRADVSSYLAQLDEAATGQKHPNLASQIRRYREFVASTVQKQQVLDKKFYIVLPFSFLELGAGKVVGKLTRRGKLPFGKDYLLEQAKIALYPKRDQLLKQLNRLGLSARVLAQPELTELYFDIYNPATAGAQKITVEAGSYTAPLVEAAIEEPPTVTPPIPQPAQPAGPAPAAQPPSQTVGEAPGIATAPTSPTSPAGWPIPAQQPVTSFPSTAASPTQTPRPTEPGGDNQQKLKELQEAITKARQGLVSKTAQPPPPSQPAQPTPGQLLRGETGDKL